MCGTVKISCGLRFFMKFDQVFDMSPLNLLENNGSKKIKKLLYSLDTLLGVTSERAISAALRQVAHTRLQRWRAVVNV